MRMVVSFPMYVLINKQFDLNLKVSVNLIIYILRLRNVFSMLYVTILYY